MDWFWIFLYCFVQAWSTFWTKYLGANLLQSSVFRVHFSTVSSNYWNSRIPLCLCLLINHHLCSLGYLSQCRGFIIIFIIYYFLIPPLFLSLSFSLLMHFLGLSFVGCCHNLASDGPVYILKCLLWSDILFCIQLLACRLCVLVSLIIFEGFKGRSQAPCSVLAYHIATHRSWLLETCKVGWLWIMSFLHRSTFSIHGPLFANYYLLA